MDKSLDKNVRFIESTLGNSTDLIIRKFPFNPANDRLIAVIYIDGLCDGSIVSEYVMEPLMQPKGKALAQLDKEKINNTDVYQLIKDHAITFCDIHDLHDYNTLFHSLMSGDAILFVDGETSAISANIRGWKDRGVTETSSENVVRGSREGFSESLRTNTALVRRRIKDPSLWIESQQIGHVSRTDVAIMYIKGLANDMIVQEVHSRLDRIDIDSVLESGYIEELIQDETMTPFPTVFYTERPDVIAAELLEGKVAIFVDGTPIVLAVPAPFVSFMHAAEDYYQRADISSFIRILRYIGIVISLLSPSFYIAVTTFHQEMIPTALLMSIASQRESVPFPAFIEAILMELTFEILREAGVRMPKYIGSAVSIVGTLVIGQAAVQAGIISAAMVIVVSLTAISSFVLPSYNMSIAFRMLRFPLMGLAASFGLVGIFAGCTAIILHLCSLRTFGVPYMTPLGPIIPSDNKDTLLRFPHRFMITRPRLINQKNLQRETPGSGQKPPQPR
ncbi:spore germination protein [Paenibacillus sp. D2_2]|uniref:spore germination protein n=1 Tax=Paenibacillus sp. D2_2 TaxID=3073092 RepID=UPI00281583F6|nr:spore germination protein [Paenibacillus sp. D2_2]WMT43379.1 spore germination protein [Paenibacillus sp. D2_2]